MTSSDIGVENFRSIGGYKANGKKVRQDMVYRSAKLDGITEEGKKMLDSLNIKTIIDFRDDEEVANSPSLYQREGLETLRIPILSGDVKQLIAHIMSGQLKRVDAQLVMCDIYHSFATNCCKQYAQFLNILLNEANYPILFHCTAGKDRTGYAAALLLLLLGVQWNDVLNSYLLTNNLLKDFIRRIDTNYIPLEAKEAFTMFMVADEQYLDTAFNVIGKGYEAVCAYATTALDFDKQKQTKLRTILLE